MRVIEVAAAALVMTCALGCTRAEQRETKDAIEAAGAEAEARIEDGVLTAAVKTKLLADTTVSGMQIDVDTRNGVVTLSGAVENQAARAKATELARATEGVLRVEDKLTVAP